MNAPAVSLAELVNRGILAIHENDQKPVVPHAPAVSRSNASSRDAIARPRHFTSSSRDTAQILDSADRLILTIQTLSTVSDDPHVLRRHILYSLELFLKDITSSR